ncbi:hypothetical protein [Falsiroseomonas sp. HW251]|uniref:hypothetical protein n=1 Tax=Falsiroseomonas sp. HW251 TaxID=3390998 RepID=UPI003D322C83
MILASAGLFVAIAGDRGGEPSALLQRLAEATVGIYGLHVAAIPLAAPHLGLAARSGDGWVTLPLTVIATFAACFAVVDTLRRIRPLRVAV